MIQIVSSHDITEWRGKEAKPDSCEDSQSSTAGVTCSICLNEIGMHKKVVIILALRDSANFFYA